MFVCMPLPTLKNFSLGGGVFEKSRHTEPYIAVSLKLNYLKHRNNRRNHCVQKTRAKVPTQVSCLCPYVHPSSMSFICEQMFNKSQRSMKLKLLNHIYNKSMV